MIFKIKQLRFIQVIISKSKVVEGTNSPHRKELLDPVVEVMKATSSVEQAVQLGADSSSLNQSLSQGSHPPDPLITFYIL